jgi:nucleotide-binding universal stress UspA family protein
VKTVLWAIDPFSDKAQQLKTGALLKALGKGGSFSVEPVAVLSPDQLRLPPSAFSAKSSDFRNEAERILNQWLKSLKLPGLKAPTILVSNDFSKRSSVKTLLQYSDEVKPSVIAMNTSAKKGIARFLWGSFAEILVMQSNVPLFVVNPNVRVVPSFKNILFPTDMGNASEMAFALVRALAKRLGAKLWIYHKLDYVIPDTYGALSLNPNYEKYLEEDSEKRRKDLESWASTATREGIKAEALFDAKAGYVTDSIFKRSKKLNACLIAMSSSSGEVSSALLGSIARQTLRGASCPVWVIHQ